MNYQRTAPNRMNCRVVVADVSGPTDIDWTPDGRILVPSKNGQLWVIENGAVVPTPAIDLAPIMCTNGEGALGSVAVHPDFASNHFVYLYYTFNKNGACNESEVDGPVNRLSRFELEHDNTIDPATETVMFDTSALYRDHHNGGDIIFASDGFLYVTVGDGGTRSLDRPQDPGYLLGKVVRLTDSGGIPPGNAFTGPGSARCNVGSIGDVDSGTWVELDITGHVTTGGDVSFRMSSTSPNGVGYTSREGGANSAQLVLELG